MNVRTVQLPLGPWLWFAGEEPDVTPEGGGEYNLAECETRDAALREAVGSLPSGAVHLIEARCFQHREEWEAEDDPIRFAETRNHERIALSNLPQSTTLGDAA